MDNDKRRLAYMAVVMAAACFIVTSLTMMLLYKEHLHDERLRFRLSAQSNARMIEAIAHYTIADYQKLHHDTQDPTAAILAQLIDAYQNYKGFGRTGEFVIGRKKGDQIQFVVRQRELAFDSPLEIPLSSTLAEPMRLALAGKSGTVIGPDYNGATVLAAYEPVAILSYGIVTKINLQEVRGHFLRAGIKALGILLVVVMIGLYIFSHISTPLWKTLKEREARFRLAVSNAPFPIMIHAENGEVVDINREWTNLSGYQLSEISSIEAWTRRAHGPNSATMLQMIQEMYQIEEPVSCGEFNITTADGHQKIWHFSSSPLGVTPEGRRIIITMAKDVSEYKAIEKQLNEHQDHLEKLVKIRTEALNTTNHELQHQVELNQQVNQALTASNRALKALSRCNEALIRKTDEDALLHDICSIIVSEAGYDLAWVGFTQSHPQKTVQVVAKSGPEEAYLKEIVVRWDDSAEGQGPVGQAIRSGRHIVIKNIGKEASFSPWRDKARQHGFTSVGAFPLKGPETVFGVLTIYTHGNQRFDKDELALLLELADDLAFGILTIRTRQEKEDLEHFVQQKNKLLRAVQKAQEAYISDQPTRHIFDQLLDAIVGLSRSEFGFINEVLYSPDGTPYLKAVALTDISWNDETKAFYDKFEPYGMEFRNLKTLFGAAVTTGELVIANSPASDPRSGGLPDGHPPLTAFLGIPIASDMQQVGLIGLANRPGGYDRSLIEFISPILTTCTNLIQAERNKAQRFQAEYDLTQSERLFRSIIETTNEGFWMLDAQNQTLKMNNAMLGILGINNRLLTTTELENYIKRIQPLIFEKESPSNIYELELQRFDGTTLPCLINPTPLFDERDRKVGTSILVADISQQKEREKKLAEVSEDLNKANRELEQKVADRTHLLESALRNAKAANQHKSEFLARMSHEIRTPINGITGMTHLCLQTVLTDQQKSYLTKIHTASETLLKIINDILDFSKIEAGMLSLEKTDFKLDGVLMRISSILALPIQQKGLELLLDIPPDLPNCLSGDPLRLEQVLINLLSNALKFTTSGEIEVRLSAIEQNAEAVTIHFSIRDTGIGIAETDLVRLFDAFAQADQSTTRKYGGTGLGLVICKRLVNMMGGDISVESRPGKGTTFAFSALFGITSPDKKAWPVCPDDLRNLRVLVVDDNTSTRKLMTKYLTSFTFEVAIADSGNAALTHLQSDHAFDLAIIDINMQGLDGIETAKRVKMDTPLERIILMAETAMKTQKALIAIEEFGLSGLVLKPVTPSTLFNAIMTAFGKAPMETAEDYSIPQIDFNTLRDTIGGLRALLVEDNELNQLVARELLEEAGLIVEIADNGFAALEAVESASFDIVLMDIQMPEIDGLQAARVIRGNPRFKDLPIIAMTAHALEGDREKSLKAGMNDHVTKPIDPTTLFAVLLRWLQPDDRPALKMLDEADAPRPELPDMPGISHAAGLKTAAFDHTLYRKMLAQFLKDSAVLTNEIQTALQKDDYETALRIAHTTKSTAGGIGALELQQEAKKLESALKRQNADQVAPQLSRFSASLDLVLDSIKGAALSPVRNSAPPAGTGDLAPQMQRLATYLKQFNTAAEDVFEALEPHLIQFGDIQASLTRLGSAIQNYAMDEAMAELTTIAEKLQIPLEEDGNGEA